MTECSKQLIFPFFKPANLTASFNGGVITSDAGLLVVRELDDRLGFTESISRLIYDWRDRRWTKLELIELIRQRVYQIIAGYEDANDANVLRKDPVFKAIAGRCPEESDLGSQPTFSRLENRVTRDEIDELNENLVRTFIRSRPEPLKEITLDIDPSEARTYGQQELTFYNGHYRAHMYFPQFVCDAKTRLFLAAVLRPGNVSAAGGAMLLLNKIVGLLRAAWPGIRIYVRADGSFAEPHLLNWLEEEGLGYTVGMPSNKALERLAASFVKAAEDQFQATHQPVQVFTSFRYQTRHSWSKPRRVIVKVEVTKLGTNIRYVIAGRGGRSQDLYRWYVERCGTIEDVIEQLKNGYEGDRMSCHRFEANAFRLLLHTGAYNLIGLFREATQVPELQNADIQTIRLKLIKVGARIERTVRRVWVHMSSSWPFAPVLRTALNAVLLVPSG